MPTFGEIKWAELINRTVPLSQIVPDPRRAGILFRWNGTSSTNLPEVGIYEPILRRKVIIVPPGASRILVTLVVSSVSANGISRTEVSFPMVWRSVRKPSLDGSVTHIFYPDRDDIFVRIPMDDPKLNKQRPLKSRSTAFVPFNDPGSTRMSGFIRQSADRYRAKARSIGNKKSGTRQSSKLRESPTLLKTSWPWGEYRNNPTITSEGTSLLESYSRTVTGVKTPNFFRLRKQDYPVNPYDLTVKKTENSLAFQKIEAQSSSTVLLKIGAFGTRFVSLPSAGAFNTSAYNKAFSKLVDKANLDVNNIAEDLLQYKQTRDLIGGNALRIFRAVNAVRKFQFRKAEQALFGDRPPQYLKGKKPSYSLSLANNWLAFQYGWKPLLKDIEGVIEANARRVAASTAVMTVRGSGSVVQLSSTSIMAPIGISLATVSPFKAGSFDFERRSRCRLVLRYKLTDAEKAFRAQLGFNNPISLAWELIPFSFVADWLLPIGPYLESYSSFDGFQFLDGSRTDFFRERLLAHADFAGLKGTTPQQVRITLQGRCSRETIIMKRTKLTSFPVQDIPNLKNPFSVTHTLNLLALVRSAFGRK